MQLSELVTAVEDVVNDERFTSTIIKTLINEAYLKIATGDIIPGRYELTSPLPDLYTVDTISTMSGVGITDLPDDYNRNLELVVNSSGEEISINSSAKQFLHKNLEETAGSVYRCTIMGNRLLYRDIPATSETLTVHYYKNPDTLTGDTDKPSAIPVTLQRRLIVGYVCREIFGKMENGMVGAKVDTAFYSQMYAGGLIDLEILIGNDEEPDYYEVTTDYC